MKNLNQVFFVAILILLLTSCRKGEYELVEAPVDKRLEVNSEVAGFMQRISMNDGSNDNIIDKANCFNIELPLMVFVNGKETIVNTEDDYSLIEAIFDEFSTDKDTLAIKFPIVVTRIDFSSVVVNTQAEFANLVSTCAGENITDDDIECIDFVYPITMSIFNKITELADRVSITNDKQLYSFIGQLDQYLVITIDFPVSMLLSDGSESTINDSGALKAKIEDVDNVCDEDDDFDYNDDDILTATEQEFVNLLTSCSVVIEEIKLNDKDVTAVYNQYIFTFNADGSVNADFSGDISLGTWVVTFDTDDNQRLGIVMDSDSLINLNNDWNLHEIEQDDNVIKIELKKGEDEIEFEQTCD